MRADHPGQAVITAAPRHALLLAETLQIANVLHKYNIYAPNFAGPIGCPNSKAHHPSPAGRYAAQGRFLGL